MDIVTFPFVVVLLIIAAEYVLMIFLPQWASKLIMLAVVSLSVALNFYTLPQLLWSGGLAGRPREPNYAGFVIGLLTVAAALVNIFMIYKSSEDGVMLISCLFITGGLLLISVGVYFSAW